MTSLENRMHGFEDGDTVTFREISGMTELNGQGSKIQGWYSAEKIIDRLYNMNRLLLCITNCVNHNYWTISLNTYIKILLKLEVYILKGF